MTRPKGFEPLTFGSVDQIGSVVSWRRVEEIRANHLFFAFVRLLVCRRLT